MIIGIFDDEIMWTNKILHHIKDYFMERDNKEYEILTVNSEEELLLIGSKIELLFLDVEISEKENGFDIAERLQQEGYKCLICFLTSHTEYARQGYKYNAYRYIDKMHLNEIDEAISSFISKIKKTEYIDCKSVDGLECKINMSDVVYIETFARKILYHLADGSTYLAEGILRKVAEQYREIDLIQVQRSYVVNMNHILRHDSRKIIMDDGTEITLSRDKIPEFKKSYFNWRRNTF